MPKLTGDFFSFTAPKEDLSGLKIEQEDHDIDLKIRQKAERLKGPMTGPMRPEKIAMDIKQEVDMAEEGGAAGGNIILNSTAEFCRTLGDIPTYGQAGNRDENNQEFMVSCFEIL